jgi:imidazolonepropionase-like amidohydrolase
MSPAATCTLLRLLQQEVLAETAMYAARAFGRAEEIDRLKLGKVAELGLWQLEPLAAPA